MNRRLISMWLAIAAASSLAAATGWRTQAQEQQVQEQPTLEQQFLKEAPGILKQLRELGCKNVGVLKFRIRVAGGQSSNHVGTLNTDLADRLELALILANDARDPIGIVRDASSVANALSGANHLTPEGREKLFDGQYSLAWGKEKIVPDAFLVGVVELSEDYQSATVGIASFTRNDLELRTLSVLQAETTLEEIGQAGENFVLRGTPAIKKAGSPEEKNRYLQAKTEAVQQIAARRARPSQEGKLPESKSGVLHPLSPQNGDAPVSLQVLYDGQSLPIEFRGGQALIPEPQQGQKVELLLSRKGADQRRYAIVLKVNGENTLGRERAKDIQCRKWVLEPNASPIRVRGYQMNDQTAQEFRVLSVTESKAREMDYGRDVGMISIAVFQEASAEATSPKNVAATPEDEDFAILKRGVFPSQPAASLADLRRKLEASDKNLTVRGLIAEGNQIQQQTRQTTFHTDPIPVMHGVIVYYKPQR